MSCCGHKRAQLRQRPAPPEPADSGQGVAEPPPRAPRPFEYVGDESLTLRGVASGMTYRFAHRGHVLEVAYEDAFAMLAEHQLKPKSPA